VAEAGGGAGGARQAEAQAGAADSEAIAAETGNI